MMTDSNQTSPIRERNSANSRSTDWYSEGETRVVETAGIQVTVRYVGRKGRRARIVIEAPGGAEFRAVDAADTAASLHSP